ncbi:MAG TPA: ATP-binding protein, partial [Polyangiaceae bacterium]|nr:ATP-binding protein [Polyangiaceae bacterium]
LTGGIAHDFNNILAAVMANVALASEDVAPNHPVQQALSEIRQASLRAAALVRQILTFSRRGVPERRWICLHDIVGEALKLLRASLPASIRIEEHFAADATEIFADPTQIHQVIMNLGTNAAHAMQDFNRAPHAGILTVSIKRFEIGPGFMAGGNELKPGLYVQLSFADNGSGMDSETLAKIFDPFFTTKEPGTGTGLGLSVVHGVVRSHDAGMVVLSKPGQGTEFNIYFPARDARAVIGDDKIASNCMPGNGEQLLCIDDELPVLRATSRLLERLGYLPVSFSDPRQALAALANTPERFAAVVSDCSMPDIWGLELVRELRRIAPNIPVVMTSGLLDPALVKDLRTLGVREFLAKPGTLEELSCALHRALHGAERESAPVPNATL